MTPLQLACVLAFVLGLGHSIVGERAILRRLARREDALPRLFGGTAFTMRTLRFVWHTLTVFGWGFAALLWRLDAGTIEPADVPAAVAAIIGWTMLAAGMLPLLITRGRHLSWVVLFVIGGLALSHAA